MRVDFAMIPELHLAARRHRAEMIGTLIATAFAWVISLFRARHAAGPHFVKGRTAIGW